MTIDLDGRVAVVTGAGRGLGRAEALDLARHGARVVVNDIGASLDGSATGDSAADEVAAEIRDLGGQAAVHHGDVADWDDAEALIRLAVSEFGSLDVLVNNAGIIRDRMIFAMTEDEFDAVVRVHLKGHFCTLRHATAWWREQSKETGGPVYARVVNTTSEAALLGSPGQPNYAAAKSGIIGLTQSTAFGCAKYGVRANAIAPRARTRMTEGVFGSADGEADPLAPEHVAPLVTWLASPAAGHVTGQVFVAYGGFVGLMGGPPLRHRVDAPTGHWDPEALGKALDEELGGSGAKLTYVASDLMQVDADT
jgi:NAD(P)-dependent dehydrogenase (short-subunit alcohol dehydrogenase family)